MKKKSNIICDQFFFQIQLQPIDDLKKLSQSFKKRFDIIFEDFIWLDKIQNNYYGFYLKAFLKLELLDFLSVFWILVIYFIFGQFSDFLL